MSHDTTKNTQIQINDQGNSLNIGPSGSMNLSSGATLTTEDGIGAKNGTGVAASEQLGQVHKTILTLTDVDISTTDNGAAGAQGSLKLYDFPQGLIEIIGAEVNLTTEAAAGIGATAALVASLGTATVGAGDATLTGTEADIHPSISGTLVDSAGTLQGKTMPTAGTLAGIASLTDSTAGSANDTVAAMADIACAGGSTPSATNVNTAVNTVLAVIRDNFADVIAKINALLAATVIGRRVFDGTGTAKDCYLNLAVPDAGSTTNSTVTVNGTVTLHWINHGDI